MPKLSEYGNFTKKVVTKTFAATVEVICIKLVIGDGTSENPVQLIEEYHTKDGRYIGTLTADSTGSE